MIKQYIVFQSVSQNQFQGQKTRMRTSFDTELELPKLQAWFAENPHPSRQQVRRYCSITREAQWYPVAQPGFIFGEGVYF